MGRHRWAGRSRSSGPGRWRLGLALAGVLALPAAAGPDGVTYSRDIAPLLATNCQGCHRDGEIAPFPLTSYDDAYRRRQKLLRTLERRKMPPWPPVPGHGDFIGDRRLADADIARLRAWVQENLTTQAMHFTAIPFEAGDGRYVLTFDPQETGTRLHPRGVRITLHGGRLASWYRIKEQRYSQIGRTAPDGTQQINTIERYEGASDGRLFATHYIVAHFPAHGANLAGLASYVNEFVEPQPALLLPSRRTIWHVEGGRARARVIELSAHRVLG